MEGSMRFGLMTVFAVSGSMVFLVHQLHKRLLTKFMKKFEFELGTGGVLYPHDQKNLDGSKKHQTKKKVRFAEDVLELPLEKKRNRIKVTRTHVQQAEDGQVLVMEDIQKWRRGPKLEDIMPLNRAVLYRGIMKYRTLKGRL